MVWSSNSLKSCITSKPLRPWAKVLGTVLQCSYFSVISRFPLKTVNHFRNFLAVLPPPTLYKVETRKKILDLHVQHCLWGEGRGWTWVNWKTLTKGQPRPQGAFPWLSPPPKPGKSALGTRLTKGKSVPRLLSRIVDMNTKRSEFS